MQPVDDIVDKEAEAEYARINQAKFNTQQRQIYDTIFNAVDEVQQGHPARCCAFFLDGPGGSGKTMLYNTLISALRARGLIRYITRMHSCTHTKEIMYHCREYS